MSVPPPPFSRTQSRALDHQHDCDEHDVPGDIIIQCRELTARVERLVFNQDLVMDVRRFQAECVEKKVWVAALASIPNPAHAAVVAIIAIKPVPERVLPRINRMCTRLGIDKAEFDKFFLGASSHGFFETLDKLVEKLFENPDETKRVTWEQLKAVISAERDKRIRGEVPGFVQNELWQPNDLDRAGKSLDADIEMGSRVKPKRKRAPAGAKPKTTKTDTETTSPRDRSMSSSVHDVELGRGEREHTQGDEVSFGDMAMPSPSPAHKRTRRPEADPPTLPFPSPLPPLSDYSPAGRPVSPLHPPRPIDPIPFPDPRTPTTTAITTAITTVASPLDPPPPIDPLLPDPLFPDPRPASTTATAITATASPSHSPLPLSWRIPLVGEDVDGIVLPKGWMTGAVMNRIFEAMAAVTATPCVAVSTDVLTPTCRASHHPAYVAHLRQASMFIFPLHISGNHWALGHIRRDFKTVAVSDSMMTPEHEEAACGSVTKFLVEFLDQDISTWQISFAACPQQVDGSSCGIFAIATAIHTLFGYPVPAGRYQVRLWRLVLARLVGVPAVADEAEATTSLWPYTSDDDQRTTHLAPFSADLVSRQGRLATGGVTIDEGRALLAAMDQAMKDAAAQTLAAMKRGIRERAVVLGELRAIQAFVNAARAAGGAAGSERGALALMIEERLGACVDSAVSRGAASVAWLRAKVSSAE
ncbi:hypothetical protein QBC39DRAFT_401479 [Podospora conica]|nr:hypothetical protein QBC39DRAFT_401479 [Schizothecium conicum]